MKVGIHRRDCNAADGPIPFDMDVPDDATLADVLTAFDYGYLPLQHISRWTAYRDHGAWGKGIGPVAEIHGERPESVTVKYLVRPNTRMSKLKRRGALQPMLYFI